MGHDFRGLRFDSGGDMNPGDVCQEKESPKITKKKSFLDHLPTILNRKKNYERHQPLTCTSCHVNCIIPNCINTIIMFNILLYCWMDCHSFSHLQIDNSILIEPRVCLLWSIFYGRKQKMGKWEREREKSRRETTKTRWSNGPCERTDVWVIDGTALSIDRQNGTRTRQFILESERKQVIWD